MNKLAVIAAGIGFLLIGYGLGFDRARRSINAQNELDSLIEAVTELDSIQAEEDANVADPEEPEGSIFDTEPAEFVEYSEKAKNYDKAEDFDKISVEFVDEEEEDEEGEVEDFEISEDPFSEPPRPETDLRTEPYTISTEVFLDEERGYEQVSWTYFRQDNIVIDFWNQVIQDPEMFLGNALQMLANAHDDFVLYVRDPKHEMEIELILDLRPIEDSEYGRRARRQKEIAEERRKRESEVG